MPVEPTEAESAFKREASSNISSPFHDFSKLNRNRTKFERTLERVFFHILVIFVLIYVIYTLSLLMSIIIALNGGIVVKFLILFFRIKRRKTEVKVTKTRKFLVPNDSLETMNQNLMLQLDNESLLG